MTTTTSTYRERIAAGLADGWRFAGLHASANGTVVRALLTAADGSTRLESETVTGCQVPSIVDLTPAAGWDEREAHDLHGVAFAGHEPLRPLVDHNLDLDTWTVPVRGHDPYQVAVGPIHAGVIESGHFRFHVVGERILYLDARLFYKHRGLEQAAVGTRLAEAAAFVGRACAACAVANGVAYAHACEDALGQQPPRELARVRTILLELERTWNHLNDIAAACAGVGLAAGNTFFAALTERSRRLNAELTGHRFLFRTVHTGCTTIDLSRTQVRAARLELAAIHKEAQRGWRELAFNASFQDRLPEVGALTRDDVGRLGTVGPAARATGQPEDVRAASPRLAYEGFVPAVPERAAGDVQARVEQRALELWQSLEILDRLLDRPVHPGTCEPGNPPVEIGVGLVESPRGATSCIVETDGDHVTRLRLRTGSYANWPSLAHAAVDNLLPDFPLINKSFELCYACADR
jgi:Ni,Fe-hydrogenase III large subunit